VSTVSRKEFVRSVFEKQCEIALENLAKLYSVVGDRVVCRVHDRDRFGTQCGPFISPKSYRDLYQPFHREVNNWIHAHTGWKSFIHSCGSVLPADPRFHRERVRHTEPGPVLRLGDGPGALKSEFGEALTFWGGGVDTQQTLPFGTPGRWPRR